MTYRSNAEEIKFYIRKLLDQGGEKTTQEIIDYVKAASGKEFTGGMLSGALKDFIDKEKDYRRVRRGVYEKAEDTGSDRDCGDDEFDAILRNAIERIENAKRIDIEELDPARLARMQEKSRRILAALHSLLED